MEGIEKFYKKEVTVRFLDVEDNEVVSVVGTLTEFNDSIECEDSYIIVESDTDYDRILCKDIRKIYSKKVNPTEQY